VNINVDCGSTHLEFLQDMMKTKRFDIGFAFDGDADRCLIVDELGQRVNGDMMLAVFARYMKASGNLPNNAFVGTVISNAGMDVFAKDNDFTFYRAPVGDRNVLQMMRETGCTLGGESSGHILFSGDTTSGDGQFVAVMFLNALISSGKTVSELVGNIPSFPQVMPSFLLTGGAAECEMIMSHPKLQEKIARIEKDLHGEGRVLIRPSGTEPIIRVMVEAKTIKLAAKKANELLDLMETLHI
jgi:phosphoglucosamine mutase